MKNREKYRDEILNSVFRGNGQEYCEFVKKNVLPNLTDCTNGECEELYSCGLCRDIFVFWLDEEYEEPEVDWSKVPVDTLVRVRDYEDDEWLLRYFKGFNSAGHPQNTNPDVTTRCYEVWALGATSVTAEGDTEQWKYCELVGDKDNGK